MGGRGAPHPPRPPRTARWRCPASAARPSCSSRTPLLEGLDSRTCSTVAADAVGAPPGPGGEPSLCPVRKRRSPPSRCTSPTWTRRTCGSRRPCRPAGTAGCRWPAPGWWSAQGPQHRRPMASPRRRNFGQPARRGGRGVHVVWLRQGWRPHTQRVRPDDRRQITPRLYLACGIGEGDPAHGWLRRRRSHIVVVNDRPRRRSCPGPTTRGDRRPGWARSRPWWPPP